MLSNAGIPGLSSTESSSPSQELYVHLKDDPAFPNPFDSPIRSVYSDETSRGHDQVLRFGLLNGGEYFGLFYADGARFAVERQGREVWADWPENYTLEDACTYLFGPVMGFVLRLRGVVCLHASAIAIGDRAIALAGPAGSGKSTTAAAFARCGFPVISDDVVALADKGDYFLVQPGYPRVNLWPDSVHALFGSENALPRITPTWEKRYLALGQKSRPFASEPFSLGAVYILGERQARPSAPTIQKISSSDAFMTLIGNTYVNYLLDRKMRSREFDVLSRVVAAVPVRLVRPTANLADAIRLCETIAADAEGIGGRGVPAAAPDIVRA